jgi:hypothetical protein
MNDPTTPLTKRGRGRPLGSTNKPKAPVTTASRLRTSPIVIDPPHTAKLLELSTFYGVTHGAMARTILLAATAPNGVAAVRSPITKQIRFYPTEWDAYQRALRETTTGQAGVSSAE